MKSIYFSFPWNRFFLFFTSPSFPFRLPDSFSSPLKFLGSIGCTASAFSASTRILWSSAGGGISPLKLFRGLFHVDIVVWFGSVLTSLSTSRRSAIEATSGYLMEEGGGEAKFLPLTVLNSASSGTIYSARLTQLTQKLIGYVIAVQIHTINMLPYTEIIK